MNCEAIRKHNMSFIFVTWLVDCERGFCNNEKSTVSAPVAICTAVTLSTNHSANIHREYTNFFIAKNVCFRFKFNYIHSDYFLKN